jgi:hypothetical protein
LDLSKNKVSYIPEEISQLSKLEYLDISHNRFAQIPCSLLQLTNLNTFILEWFEYASPAMAKEVTSKNTNGRHLFDSMFQLFSLLNKYQMRECALITFLENFSESNFDKNFRDNRMRTILHQAAVLGDTGVINGLLMDKVDTNVLDKD